MRRLIPIVALIAVLAMPGAAQSALPLGPPKLKERSNTRVLAPGVRLTRIVRGHRGRERWTVDVMVVRGRDAARRFAGRVRAKGFDARIRRFAGPLGPRRNGYRVFTIRSGAFATEKRATRRATRLNKAGFKNSNVAHTSDNGTRSTTGPWRLRILRIKPRQLQGGRLAAVLANDRILDREKPTSMGRRLNAVAGVNAGYFVVDGTGEGDLAGTLAIDGQLLSEPLNGRTNFVLPDISGAGGRLAQLSYSGDVTIDGAKRLLDGINRVRGEIRSCGGTGGDRPTQKPFHDVTCTDESELVQLTPSFGADTATKVGGVEVVVRNGVVTQVIEGGSTPIPSDGYVLSGSGDAATFLRQNAQPGDRPGVRADVLERGLPFDLTERSIVNGGPALVRDGRFFVRGAAEGFVHPNDPSFYFNFAIRRNPRTLVGIRPDGVILLVVADGRQPRWSVGLSFAESADVLRSLGARQGMNLDGGGSSAMALGGSLLGRPSDDTGERPVGDGLFLLR